jgi:hypothetical protein
MCAHSYAGSKFIRHEAGEAGLHSGLWAVAFKSIEYADHAHAAKSQPVQQRCKLLATRQASKVGYEEDITGLDRGHCSLESRPITERCAGDAFICEVSSDLPTARFGVLVTAALLVDYGGFCLPVRVAIHILWRVLDVEPSVLNLAHIGNVKRVDVCQQVGLAGHLQRMTLFAVNAGDTSRVF